MTDDDRQWGDVPGLRIGDAERQGTVDALRVHLGAGRIDLGEFEDRAGMAYAARTVEDLRPLTLDLPPVGAGSTPTSVPRRPVRSRGLRLPGHLRPLVGVVALCVLIWAMTGAHLDQFWPVWVAGPWLAATFLFGGHHRHGRRPCGPGRRSISAGDWDGGPSRL